MKTFKDIIAWQKGYELTLFIYKLTAQFPKEELFSLVSQLRRASVSYISNIAEGFGRQGLKEAIHFYRISRGSLEEVRCQLILAKDLHYISLEDYKRVEKLCETCSKMLNGWINSQNNLIRQN